MKVPDVMNIFSLQSTSLCLCEFQRGGGYARYFYEYEPVVVKIYANLDTFRNVNYRVLRLVTRLRKTTSATQIHYKRNKDYKCFVRLFCNKS